MSVNGQKQVPSAFIWGDGNVYVGNFEANNIEGTCRYGWNNGPNSGREFNDNWKEDKMHGYGVEK